MAKNGFQVVDSDMHVLEPWDLWPRYIDAEFKEQAPIGHTEVVADTRLNVRGQNVRRVDPKTRREDFVRRREEILQEPISRGFDAVSQLSSMDREGIDRTVLFPTRGLIAMGMEYEDPRLGAAVARAYNDWIAEFCAEDPVRLMAAAMISVQDVEEAVAEVRRADEKLGLRAIFLRPNPVYGRNWHDPAYDPLWAECEGRSMPVCFHESTVTMLPEAVAERFREEPELQWMMAHVASHPIEMMYAVLCVISGGVLERFPKLRMAFMEANSAWVPYWLWRMDAHWEADRSYTRPIPRPPSEYFHRQLYTSVEVEETIAKYNIDWMGNDHILFASDYPHVDSHFPNAVDKFLELPFDEETQRKILWDNSVRLYGLS